MTMMNEQRRRQFLMLLQRLQDSPVYVQAGLALSIALLGASPIQVITAIARLVWTSIGLAIGIGLGLGFALHVYEQLQSWQYHHASTTTVTTTKQYENKTKIKGKGSTNNYAAMGRLQSSNVLEDGSSYFSLMALAGYNHYHYSHSTDDHQHQQQHDDKVLRGQVIRSDALFWKRKYSFTDVPVSKQMGPTLLRNDWPGLPEPVTRELGRVMEHVMRDFISSWYSRLDGGCQFTDEREKRQLGIVRDGGGSNNESGGGNDVGGHANNKDRSPMDDEDEKDNNDKDDDDDHKEDNGNDEEKGEGSFFETKNSRRRREPRRPRRQMVFSTLTHRNIPMLDQTYRVLSTAFGSLATRAEHLNIFSLILLKWTQVLSHTFKQYRILRKSAQNKQQQQHSTQPCHLRPPTEIQVIREFLLAGKLHKAVTFGMDVPSLLFADAHGTECGTGTNNKDNHGNNKDNTTTDPDAVLNERLFETPMLKECELDYNRVVAFRLVKALLPRNDSASPVVMALVTEIMGTCVLQPLMNLWIPSFLNECIVNATTTTQKSQESKEPSNNEQESRHNTNPLEEVFQDNPNPTGQEPTVEEAMRQGQQDDDNTSPLDAQDEDAVIMEPDDIADETSVTATPLEIKSSASIGDSSTAENVVGEEEIIHDRNRKAVGDVLLQLSAMAISDLQQYVDLEQCRTAKRNDQLCPSVNFEDPACQEVVLRLVMVVEAALLQGRCSYRHFKMPQKQEQQQSSSTAEDLPLELQESLAQLLMEMTSDMDAFEKRIGIAEGKAATTTTSSSNVMAESNSDMDFEPDPNEISTLRTLISTWMHTGQLARATSLIIRGINTHIFGPYYRDDAFLALDKTAPAFKKQMDRLDNVDVMVETIAFLASPRLDIEAESMLLPKNDEEMDAAPVQSIMGGNSETHNHKEERKPFTRHQHHDDSAAFSASDMMAHHLSTTSTPRFLDFHKNLAFASSLRSERERRLSSWESQKADESLQSIHRPGASPSEIELHSELHSLAKMFCNGTTLLSIRDAARKSGNEALENSSTASLGSATTRDAAGRVSLVTVETISNRRRIEVPDDDSSFLLRAQPRPLNPVSVHRDDRNHDLSYKCYFATYEETTVPSTPNRMTPGRYIRRCFLQYYPIDRTATVMLHNDARKLDRRKGKPIVQDQLNQHQQPAPYLSGAFLRERHLCQKWTQRGNTTQNFLSSSVMEASDFNATPRSGRALDFIYRVSLFERPRVELAGKRFTVQDSTSRGHHRSDASSLEISDASLSAVLYGIGKDFGYGAMSSSDEESTMSTNDYRHNVEMGPDGYPLIFMKFTRKSNEEASTEIKPYRASFVRAAIMITSARQEAQLQCLTECVRAGSAKSATKARTDAHLRPTMKILEFVNDRTPEKLRTTSLLRDLKLGVYHIDREQLRRNGLLNPRFPTAILDLTATVEGAVQAKDVAELSGSNRIPPTSTLYKIRCLATVELVATDDDKNELGPYLCDDGVLANQYYEEWTIFRSMKDFQILHKHLKSQVSNTESSVGTGSRLVGAATAAFSNSSQARRNRRALVPSLAQASKTGAIAVTQKAIAKRGELLGDYLSYLLAPNHIMNRSMDVLLFLGASFPFPSEVLVGKMPVRLVDPLGRTSFVRLVASRGSQSSEGQQNNGNSGLMGRLDAMDEPSQQEIEGVRGAERSEEQELIESIMNKIDQVPLVDVRNRLVELAKYQFGFENASFFRSRILAALETASFVAMTKGSEFRKLLYRTHTQQLNPEAIGKLIEKALDILWPDGCWLTPRPVLTVDEEASLREDSRRQLHDCFPDQLRAILGTELTRDGLDMVHEMLQNRLVVKSLFYMLFDLVWIDVFPELRDALPCASALGID